MVPLEAARMVDYEPDGSAPALVNDFLEKRSKQFGRFIVLLVPRLPGPPAGPPVSIQMRQQRLFLGK